MYKNSLKNNSPPKWDLFTASEEKKEKKSENERRAKSYENIKKIVEDNSGGNVNITEKSKVKHRFF